MIGAIGLTATAGDIRAVATSGNVSSVQIGHGGRDYLGNVVDQAISVAATGDIFLVGGTQVQSSSLIGHGGGGASGGDISGEILLAADGDLAVWGGGGFLSFAQVGHGGALATSTFSGNIGIVTGGDVSVLAPTSAASGAYAKIGHGDDMRGALAAIGGTGTRLGDVEIAAAGGITLTEALLGHRNTGSLAVSGGTVMVGVSADDPANVPGDDLVADAETEFTGDEVRFYLPRRANNRIAAGALMNGVAYGGGLSDPWPAPGADEFTRFLLTDNGVLSLDEHDSTFGSGPVPTTAGAYGFYFDTLVQGDPPQPDAAFVSLLPTPPSETPLQEVPEFLDDRLLLDSIDQQEARFSGPGFTEIFYEGFSQYGTNGEVHFQFTDPGQLTPTELPYFAPAGVEWGDSADGEDILQQHLDALEQNGGDESEPEEESSEEPSAGELASGAEG